MTWTANKHEAVNDIEKKAFIFKTCNIPVTIADFEEEMMIATLIAI